MKMYIFEKNVQIFNFLNKAS